ncbi:MAG: ribosome assembly factor SBDS [Candidatus Marsarchaeota archaeon]|nr:ribosome assembly factor SBDS [Candidatus Marsarchaeota archaeon]
MSSKYIVARYEVRGHRFEVLVKPDEAWEYRNGKRKSMTDVLVSEEIFKDAGKGLRAPENLLKEVFGTQDPYTIAHKILTQGELQLTAQQRQAMTENTRRQIITYIARNCVDPKTGLPHPPTRIELALEQVRFAVNPYKSVEEQALEAMKLLRTILPLKVSISVLEIKVPANFRKTYGQVAQLGSVKSTSWGTDGSYTVTVEIPGGMKPEVIEKVNSLTHGQAEIKEASVR